MGLDMYLHKKHYVMNWDWMSDKEKHTISVKQGGKKVNKINTERVAYIVELVMEWRKFNALHKWFVDNVQDGVDDCRESYVDVDDLKMLLETLTYVLENKDTATELLPPTNGFFFGTDVMDKWYWNDIESTIIQLKNILEEDNSGAHFYYRSSW
jgi:hypothetical protein